MADWIENHRATVEAEVNDGETVKMGDIMVDLCYAVSECERFIAQRRFDLHDFGLSLAFRSME